MCVAGIITPLFLLKNVQVFTDILASYGPYDNIILSALSCACPSGVLANASSGQAHVIRDFLTRFASLYFSLSTRSSARNGVKVQNITCEFHPSAEPV